MFECMEGNLYQLTKSRKGRPLAGGLVASIYEQIILGLDHIHSHGYFHRDMKPENLLITTTGLADYPPSSPTALPGTPPEKDVLVIVKLADFGLARETDSKPPYTEYVSTRWYRAPEVLLRSRDYSNPVDMWALGTILAELVNLKPLFPGQSEVDQVLQICDVLGNPSPVYGKDEKGRVRGGGEWDRGIKMAKAVGFEFPKLEPIRFSTLFSSRIPSSLVECIQDLLRYDPKARLTSQDCLKHPYMVRDAPRLRPPQAKPVVSATSPIRKPTVMPTIQLADRMPDYASRRAIPPSHSEPLSPQPNKPAFGANDPKSRLMPQGPNGMNPSPLHRVPFYAQSAQAQMGPGAGKGLENHPSPMQEDAADIQWAPAPVPSVRDSSASNYPAFPDSASMYAGSHASMLLDDQTRIVSNGGSYRDQASDAQMTETTLRPSSRDLQHQQQALQAHQYRQYQQQQQQQGKTVYDDDLTAAYGQERAARQYQQMQDVGSAYAQQAVKGAAQASGMTESTSELSQRNDSNASNETIGSKDREKRRSKGWGLNLFSSNSPQNASGNISGPQGSASLKRSPSGNTGQAGDQRSQQFYVQSAQTPAQKIAAEHAAASAAAPTGTSKPLPLDPKKAKKEAEKAAREAEKARREAQQKAARDRARAVMQKRNQLLAASTNKDPVEWLTGINQTEEPAPFRTAGHSEKARGKQPVPPGSQMSPSMQSFPSGDFPRSPHNVAQALDQPMSPNYPGHAISPSMQSSMAWRSVGGSRYSNRSNKVRRREYDDDHSMSSFEDAMDPRRASMQSYQTGDSDPGPVSGQAPVGHRMHRANSSSSLASAPSISDARRFAAASMESHRSSQDTRSISSLDHQLITNMENMTAAEARTRTPGNVSPGPVHLVGSRQSVSRQSRANSRASSASAHRAGSASPLHHASGIPRFHPYSHGGSQATTPNSYHQSFQLAPLHQSRAADVSRGSMGSAEGTHLPPLGHYQHQHQHQHGPGQGGHPNVNPIFQVPNSGNGQQTLPPFSQIAAAVDVQGSGAQQSPSPTQQIFYGSSHGHGHMS